MIWMTDKFVMDKTIPCSWDRQGSAPGFGEAEKERVDQDPNLKMPKLLSSTVAPQRDAHVVFQTISHSKVLQIDGSLQKEKQGLHVPAAKYAPIHQCANQAERSN